MGVRTLIGEADGTTHAAMMYCSASGWSVGPIFEAPDAEDHIEAFQAWLREHRWYSVRRDVFRNPDLPGDAEVSAFMGEVGLRGDGDDPRDWSDAALQRLVTYWRSVYVGGDGWLLDPLDCSCGHHHLAGDDGEDAGCASCACATWTPGNRAAELRAADGESVLV